jgi:hypothetical protein
MLAAFYSQQHAEPAAPLGTALRQRQVTDNSCVRVGKRQAIAKPCNHATHASTTVSTRSGTKGGLLSDPNAE